MDGWIKYVIGGVAACGAGLIGFINHDKLGKAQFEEFKDADERRDDAMHSTITSMKESNESNFNRIHDKLDAMKKR